MAHQWEDRVHDHPHNDKELARDEVALVLSLIPGLGQIYKGHVGHGVLLLLIITPAMLWMGALLSLATMGFGLVVPAGYWIAVAAHAYLVEDNRKHHMGML